MATISSISHLTLPVADLGLAERFYVGLLGLQLAHRFDRETFLRLLPHRAADVDADNSALHLQLRCDGTQIDLFLQRKLARSALRPHPHLAFDVSPKDLDVLSARIREWGVPVDGPRRLGPPGQASAYFSDPFGNLLELATMGYEGEVSMGPPDLSKLAYELDATHGIATATSA